MKKSIAERFHKLEGMKMEGSKIPAQPTGLTQDHLEILAACEGGSTIWGWYEATMLREVQRYDEKLVTLIDDMSELERILDRKFDGAKQMPYFGAVLTKKGKSFLKKAGYK